MTPTPEGAMTATEALVLLRGMRVFLTSRERIKQPEGSDLFDECIAALAAMQQPDSGDLTPPLLGDELDAVFMAEYLPMVAIWCANHGAHATGVDAIRQAGQMIREHAAQLAAKDRELQELRQACWEARATLGFDNDGDPTPDALTFPTLAVMVKRDAAEFRKDYDDACNGLAEYVVLLRAKEAHAEAQDRIILSEQVRCTAAEQRADAAMGLLPILRTYVVESMNNDCVGDGYHFSSAMLADIDKLLAGGAAEAPHA